MIQQVGSKGFRLLRAFFWETGHVVLSHVVSLRQATDEAIQVPSRAWVRYELTLGAFGCKAFGCNYLRTSNKSIDVILV